MSLISFFLDDSNVILYRPQVNRVLKFAEATLLLSQIGYWWKKQGYVEYYKFKEPCSHRDYKEGQSWTEELGITRYAFDKALAILVKMELVSVKVEKIEHKTYFSINRDNLELFLKVCYPKVDGQLSGKSKVNRGENLRSSTATAQDERSYNTDITRRLPEIAEKDFSEIPDSKNAMIEGLAKSNPDLAKQYQLMLDKKSREAIT